MTLNDAEFDLFSIRCKGAQFKAITQSVQRIYGWVICNDDQVMLALQWERYPFVSVHRVRVSRSLLLWCTANFWTHFKPQCSILHQHPELQLCMHRLLGQQRDHIIDNMVQWIRLSITHAHTYTHTHLVRNHELVFYHDDSYHIQQMYNAHNAFGEASKIIRNSDRCLYYLKSPCSSRC